MDLEQVWLSGRKVDGLSELEGARVVVILDHHSKGNLSWVGTVEDGSFVPDYPLLVSVAMADLGVENVRVIEEDVEFDGDGGDTVSQGPEEENDG